MRWYVLGVAVVVLAYILAGLADRNWALVVVAGLLWPAFPVLVFVGVLQWLRRPD